MSASPCARPGPPAQSPLSSSMATRPKSPASASYCPTPSTQIGPTSGPPSDRLLPSRRQTPSSPNPLWPATPAPLSPASLELRPATPSPHPAPPTISKTHWAHCLATSLCAAEPRVAAISSSGSSAPGANCGSASNVTAEKAGPGGLWICWPKKASGVKSDLSERVVRETGLANGLVDYKIASIDQTWSGLRFTRRKPR